jgi:hypothetical protein
MEGLHTNIYGQTHRCGGMSFLWRKDVEYEKRRCFLKIRGCLLLSFFDSEQMKLMQSCPAFLRLASAKNSTLRNQRKPEKFHFLLTKQKNMG